VAGRLSRGRELLRQRLSRRRGLVLPLFLSGGTPTLVPAPVPDPLVSATVASASAGGPAGSPATSLAAAVLSAANRRRLGLFLLLLLGSVVLAAAVWGSRPALASPHNSPDPRPTPGGCHS
jgi:hypothetical protein